MKIHTHTYDFFALFHHEIFDLHTAFVFILTAHQTRLMRHTYNRPQQTRDASEIMVTIN